MIPNFELRRRAWKVLKPVLPIALLVSLCAELPSLLSQVAMTISQQPLQRVLDKLVEADPTRYSTNQLIADLQNAINPGMLWVWLGALLAFVLTPFLHLGRLHFTLKLLRGQEGDVQDIFSRTACFVKAVGLTLYKTLLLILWSLPGVAVMVAGVAVLYANPTSETLNVMTGLYSIGMILSMVLMVRATLHYAMSELFMADTPTIGIRAAVRQSVDMMKTRKMMYFSLQIFFFALLLLCGMVQGMLEGLSVVVAMTLSMAAQLVVSVYRETAVAAFYEAYRPGAVPYVEVESQPLNGNE